LKLEARSATISRKTNETDIYINLNLDGTGKSKIETGCIRPCLTKLRASRANGLGNFGGDLEVDEHHTIEDTAIALGEVLRKH
jgi:imidazoleglycerol-phosphate dehydratase/histidinol-phosphatase